MTYELPKSFKCCLTCAFWCGIREAVMIERYARTEDAQTKGRCACQKGLYNLDVIAMGPGCAGYQPWPVLKD